LRLSVGDNVGTGEASLRFVAADPREGKALRNLVKAGTVARLGRGGLPEPYMYMVETGGGGLNALVVGQGCRRAQWGG
jgi:hypothetical protein